MRITLIDGEVLELSNTNNVLERIEIVEGILNKYGNCELECLWNQPSTKYLLEGLSNYLVWCKTDDELYKQDKNILSKRKTKEIHKFTDKNIPFSALSKTDQRIIGVSEVEESYE